MWSEWQSWFNFVERVCECGKTILSILLLVLLYLWNKRFLRALRVRQMFGWTTWPQQARHEGKFAIFITQIIRQKKLQRASFQNISIYLLHVPWLVRKRTLQFYDSYLPKKSDLIKHAYLLAFIFQFKLMNKI